MILQRAEGLADLELHFAGRLDILENNHAAIFEDLVDILADCFVRECLPINAGDSRAKRKIVPQWLNFYRCHSYSLLSATASAFKFRVSSEFPNRTTHARFMSGTRRSRYSMCPELNSRAPAAPIPLEIFLNTY